MQGTRQAEFQKPFVGSVSLRRLYQPYTPSAVSGRALAASEAATRAALRSRKRYAGAEQRRAVPSPCVGEERGLGCSGDSVRGLNEGRYET